jgi:starch phosphorylase
MSVATEASPAPALDLEQAITSKLLYAVGKDPQHAQIHDWYAATALALRDRVVDRWLATTRRTRREKRKRVYYLSLEFLIGRLLTDTASNLGLTEECRIALRKLGIEFSDLRELEPDAALGNGGLGRLAACFMESMATMGLAGFGYGIRYDHGLFRQAFKDGWQVELPEDWLDYGNPWEFERPEVAYKIKLGGWTEAAEEGSGRSVWHSAERVLPWPTTRPWSAGAAAR